MAADMEPDDDDEATIRLFVEGLLRVTEKLLEKPHVNLSMADFLVVVASYAASVIESAEMDASERRTAYERLEHVFRERWVS